MGGWTKMEMNEQEIITKELQNSGTSWTRNEFFDTNGYLIIKDLCDPNELYYPVPEERGVFTYWGDDVNKFHYEEVEGQVVGSLSRYHHPQYKKIYDQIREVLESVIGRKLYNTYYYDRFYFPGQELRRHIDRPACEISVSVHVSDNINENWPFNLKTPDKFLDKTKSAIIGKGEVVSVDLQKGDGLVYKGCERPHWRDIMPGTLETINGVQGLYYHQIFFHYVLQDGIRAHYAFDRG